MHSFAGNRVTAHTGTEFPVFEVPIGLISRAELVAVVSAAGVIVRATLHACWEEGDKLSSLGRATR